MALFVDAYRVVVKSVCFFVGQLAHRAWFVLAIGGQRVAGSCPFPPRRWGNGLAAPKKALTWFPCKTLAAMNAKESTV